MSREDVRVQRQTIAHAPQRDFTVADNVLQVAGTPVTELVERSRGRPFYAYDGEIMRRRVDELKRILPSAVKLHYAVKANPMPEVVRFLAQQTDGLDVASARELEMATAAGATAQNISFAGPGKSEDDLRAGVRAGVIMVIESATEAQRIAGLARDHNLRPPCAIRVNPDFQLQSSGMVMGGGSQPFGIDAEQVPNLLDSLRSAPLDIRGFHIFCGSQNLNGHAIIDAQRQTLELASRLTTHLPAGLRWLNIGGGFGVPYFPGDEPLDLNPILNTLAERLDEHDALLRDTEIVLELGRYLVAPAGIYVCQVRDRKTSRDTTYVVTNGGLHHHLAATGNFGQVIRRNYPLAVANRIRGAEEERVTVVGPLCTPLDLLGKDVNLPKPGIGDSIAVFMSGAYGYSASPHGFLSHPEPLEFFLPG